MAAATSSERVDSFVGRILFRGPPEITTWRPGTKSAAGVPVQTPNKPLPVEVSQRFSLLTTRKLVWGESSKAEKARRESARTSGAPPMKRDDDAIELTGSSFVIVKESGVQKLAAAWVAIGLLVAFSGIAIGAVAAEKAGEPDASAVLASIAPQHAGAKAEHVPTSAWKAPAGVRSEVVDHDMLIQAVEPDLELASTSTAGAANVAAHANGAGKSGHAKRPSKKHPSKKSHQKHGH